MENIRSFSSKQIYVEVSYYIPIFRSWLNNKFHLTEKRVLYLRSFYFHLIMNSLFYLCNSTEIKHLIKIVDPRKDTYTSFRANIFFLYRRQIWLWCKKEPQVDVKLWLCYRSHVLKYLCANVWPFNAPYRYAMVG